MSMRSAAKAALKSTHRQHRMGAVIVKGGNILATGYNTMQPSSLLKTATRHAEAAAILKVLKEGRQHDLVGADIHVFRFTRGGRIGLARPCPQCSTLLRSVGISKVHYTTDEGATERMKL